MILETLKKRRDQELANSDAGEETVILDNPVYQKVQILKAETEANISSLQARRAEFEKKNRELKKVIEVVPKIEAELQRLNRDYEVHRQNYTSLVKRRETARISEEADSDTDQVQFRVIEPPFVPLNPSFPNRKVLDLAVLILALGCGYGLSLLVSLIKPVYYVPSELSKLVDYPILGGVSSFDTQEIRWKRYMNLTIFAGANFLLVTTVAVFVYLHSREIAIIEFMKFWSA
jgi:polysaccharide chain length determinant protein (PEP-CTERM system associated)